VVASKTLWQNLRCTSRVPGKNSSFTVVAVFSLALGIGANTAIFTGISALRLRVLPVRQPDRLVEVSLLRLGSKLPFSYPMLPEIERGQRVLTGLIGVDLGCQWHAGKMLNLEGNRVPSQNHPLWVKGNFYSEPGAVRDRYRHSLRAFAYPAYRQHALWSFPRLCRRSPASPGCFSW
jgi:hypothetical protein